MTVNACNYFTALWHLKEMVWMKQRLNFKSSLPESNRLYIVREVQGWPGLCQQHKRFYSDSATSPGHHVWVHHFEMSVLQGAHWLFQTNENHWGLSQGCKEGVTFIKFAACGWALPCSSMSSLRVSHVLLNCLVHIIVKQDTVTLSISCYTMWKKISINQLFWVQIHTCHVLPSWQLFL